jgi:YebC/PmpR family DNA-binding regulatory protein
VPNANIDRAIAKGAGSSGADAELFEAVRYEGYGAGGVAVLVEAFTDNRNRTAADLRLAFGKQGGNLGETGCVSYLFVQRSVVRVALNNSKSDDEEAFVELLLALEEGGGPAVLSWQIEMDGAEVVGEFADLEALQDGLRRLGLEVREWEHRWIPVRPCHLENPESVGACMRMLEAIEDLDDVRAVVSNLEVDDSLLEQIFETSG